MIFQETKRIVEKWVSDEKGPKYAVMPETLFEDDLYFVFLWNTKRYLETKDFFDSLIGQGPTLLDKREGRFFEYGSGWSILGIQKLLAYHIERAQQEALIRSYFREYDMRKHYQVSIQKVYAHRRLIQLLDSMQLTYIIPEIVSGVIWRVPQQYNKELLKQRLVESVPIVFRSMGNLEDLYQLLETTNHCRLCEISIDELQAQKVTYDSSKVKPEDLEPEW